MAACGPSASRAARNVSHKYNLNAALYIKYGKNGMYYVHMACCMTYTINISIINIIRQYFFVFNKFSVINLL